MISVSDKGNWAECGVLKVGMLPHAPTIRFA